MFVTFKLSCMLMESGRQKTGSHWTHPSRVWFFDAMGFCFQDYIDSYTQLIILQSRPHLHLLLSNHKAALALHSWSVHAACLSFLTFGEEGVEGNNSLQSKTIYWMGLVCGCNLLFGLRDSFFDMQLTHIAPLISEDILHHGHFLI